MKNKAKKKQDHRGTIEMVFAVGEKFMSFEAKSIYIDAPEIKKALEQITAAAGLTCNCVRDYDTYAYGMRIIHCAYLGDVPFDKMPDFIKAARAAGFRVKE